jgi:hypothetical protein
VGINENKRFFSCGTVLLGTRYKFYEPNMFRHNSGSSTGTINFIKYKGEYIKILYLE